jgi:hypothetical protein
MTDAAEGGVLEIRTNETSTSIFDFAVERNAHFDASEFTDLAGTLSPLPQTNHAKTHMLHGGDEVSASSLADRDSRTLSPAESLLLIDPAVAYAENTGVGLELHSHSAWDVSTLDSESDPALWRDGTLAEHAYDAPMHPTARPLPPPTCAHDAQDGEGEATGGTSEAFPARADHSHVIPFWLIDTNSGISEIKTSDALFLSILEGVSASGESPILRYPYISPAGGLTIVSSMHGRSWSHPSQTRIIARMMVYSISYTTAYLRLSMGSYSRIVSADELAVSAYSTNITHGEREVTLGADGITYSVPLNDGINELTVRLAMNPRLSYDLVLTWVDENAYPLPLFGPGTGVNFVSPFESSLSNWNV